MTTALIQTLSRPLAMVAAASLLALVAPPRGNTQGLGVSATRTTTQAAFDPNALQKQLTALELRVRELEKQAIESADDAAEAEAAAVLLDQRLRDADANFKRVSLRVAQLEKDGAGDKPAAEREARADGEGPMTITAPFTVVDEDGKPLLRVGEDDGSFSRGLYVFNAQGASIAHMGARSDGLGRIYASRPNVSPTAVLTAQPEGGALLLGSGSGFIVELNRQSLSFMSDNKATVALFGTKNRAKGYLELNDANGSKMVEAGMLNNNKGYVLASPYRATVDPQGDPSVLKGAGK